MLRLTNSLTGDKVEFTPRDPGKASVYWCGPTVYDAPHVGHARSTLAFDILVRYLRWTGLDVTAVSNITDIDDNIIARAAEEGTTEPELARRFEEIFIAEMDRLDIAHPDLRPRATEYVGPMVDILGQLVDRGMAYATDSDKTDPLDFALWKAAKPGEPTCDSPWGPGRPGWHIECVAMSLDLLGDGFDIHGGGDDLTFPHHENERAECLGCGRPFARLWVHNGMVQVGTEKMSKSLGNFWTLAELLDNWDPRALRLLVLQTHYRKTMEIGEDTLRTASAALERLDGFARRIAAANLPDTPADEATVDRFRQAMDDDLGTAAAMAIVFAAVRDANRALDAEDADTAAALAAAVTELSGVLGLRLAGTTTVGDDGGAIDGLVTARSAAKAAEDYAEADRIRDELTSRGIVLEDSATGTTWRRA